MWQYPEIDPVAVSVGPVQLHWYGISYLVGLALAWTMARRRTGPGTDWSDEDLADMAFYAAIGTVLGGRIGYMMFYGSAGFLDNPLVVLRIWEGGMSFHGGMVGVFLAMYAYSTRHRRRLLRVMDFIAPVVPLGLAMGRLGNFANTELPGRETSVPWGVVFPGEDFARHPSSLYQFFLEGPVLFSLLWWYSMKERRVGSVTGLFLIGYGSLRLLSELFRQPDPHLQFVAFDAITMGQMLSLPMLAIGGFFVYIGFRVGDEASPTQAPPPPTRSGKRRKKGRRKK